MTRRSQSEVREPAVDALPAVAPRSPRWLWWLPLTLAVLFAGLLLYQLTLMQDQLRLIQEQSDSLRAGQQAQLFWNVCQPATPARERTSAFLQLVKLGHQEWRSAVLNELELAGSDLSLADLRFTDLTASDLSRTTLQGTLLTDSNLRLVDLSEAILSDALLDGADLLKANLGKADLRKARMRRCSLEQAQCQGAVFILADLSEARMVMTDLSGATMTGAKLEAANLEWARLIGTDLTLATLSDATLENADLTNSNWWRARGLSEAQREDLSRRFPPNSEADAARREDYQLWLQSRTSGETTESQPSSP